MMQQITTCKGCGCTCLRCCDQTGLHLHVEIESLKERLMERERHIVTMETNFLKEAEKFPNGEMAAITEELLTWQDKYSRLYESHKRVQKVNQSLEDKLLRIVDKCETEKNTLISEVGSLTRRLVDEKFNVARLQDENERYRNDVNLTIQLLQCKPSNFVSQKYDSLPSDLQQKVRTYVSNKRRLPDGNGNMPPKPEMKTIKVPIPTFPPTAMVYSINRGMADKELSQEEKNNSCKQGPVDIVSAAIMAKVLEEREKERSQSKHCESCMCHWLSTSHSKSTQTDIPKDRSSLPQRRETGKVGLSPMMIQGKGFEKQTPERSTSPCEFSILATERARRSFKKNEKVDRKWDVDRPVTPTLRHFEEMVGNRNESVSEGLLVNIESCNMQEIIVNERNPIEFPSAVGSKSWGKVTDPVVSSETEDVNLIRFDKSPGGPRHCSVRLQAGSSNILLDNVMHPFTPVLYKSRLPDPLVHPPFRSHSASSSSSADDLSSPAFQVRTETQI